MQVSKFVVFFFLAMSSQIIAQGDEGGQRLRIRAYLEGALINNGNAVSEDGKPLMRDNLRVSPFNNLNYLPATDPYQTTISDINLSTINTHVGTGSSPEFCTVAQPEVVFGVTGDNAIVDWVFVEIRKANQHNLTLATRSGLLQRDGDVVDVDGVSDLWFPTLIDETFHVVIRHRNHLGVMTQIVTSEQIIDFTSAMTPLFDFGTTIIEGLNYGNLAQKTNVVQGYRALWAGDFNSDCKIKLAIPNDDLTTAFYEQDYSGTGYTPGYFQGDFDMNSVVTFTGSPNDAALLENQAKTYNLNPTALPNFNYFIEQVPPRN